MEAAVNCVNGSARDLLSDNEEVNCVIMRGLPLHLLLKITLWLVRDGRRVTSKDETVCLVNTRCIKNLSRRCEDLSTLRKRELLCANEKLCLGSETLDDLLGARRIIPELLPGTHLIIALRSTRSRIIEWHGVYITASRSKVDVEDEILVNGLVSCITCNPLTVNERIRARLNLETSFIDIGGTVN